MQSKPEQYLLVGLPYSGKTTLALKLKNDYGFAHINIDEIKFSKGYTGGDDDVSNKGWDENQILKQRFHWPESELLNYIKDFEEPTEDEKVIIYDQTIPAGQWIEKSLIG